MSGNTGAFKDKAPRPVWHQGMRKYEKAEEPHTEKKGQWMITSP